MSEAQAEQIQAPQATKAKKAQSGDVIVDTAQEIENLTKTKALNLADKLVDDIDTNSFRLGGCLKKIFEQQWWEGHPSFGAFVHDKYGFQERKARYLIEIYENLVTKMIPWDKVKGLGWTKLKDLARHLTPENVDEMVAKAEKLTVTELQAMLKGATSEGEGSEKTTSDTTKLAFKLKNDQLETVQAALAKAKAETQTEFDNVAIENICAGFLGGVTQVANKPADLKSVMAAAGWETVLNTFGELFPDVDLEITTPEMKAQAAKEAANQPASA